MTATQNPPGPGVSVEIRDYVRIIWERKWAVILCLVIVVGIVVGLTMRQIPRYRASSQVMGQQTSVEIAAFGSQVFGYWDIARKLQTVSYTITSEPVARMVKDDLGSGKSPEQLAAMVQAAPSENSDVITITAYSTDPQEAADVANSFAHQLIEYRRGLNTTAIALAREVLQRQIDALTPLELETPSGISLQNRLEQLALTEELQTGDFDVSKSATVPGAPYTPQPIRNALLAVAVGLAAGVGLAFLLEYLDRRLKDDEQMEQEFGLPVLAMIPKVKEVKGSKKTRGRAHTAVGFREDKQGLLEAFRGLRSNLQYYEVDRRLRTLLITSALAQEGKTVTTINLGMALALSGERVIIIEGDLRRPMLHRYLDLNNVVGISNVLAGTHSLSQVAQPVGLEEFVSPSSGGSGQSTQPVSMGGGQLLCVTSGPLPPNPPELLASERMHEIIEQAAGYASHVLIDSTPLLMVADALSLLGFVDGVLITARMNHTTRDEARRVRSVLERVGGDVRPIGVVAGGVDLKGHYYYKYGYYGREAESAG